MKSAREWREYYARERERLGERGLAQLLDEAPAVELPPDGALIFPHTRLAESGRLPAAAALAVLRSGRSDVLALGVLHGAREVDAALVTAARAGDLAARAALRRIHGPGLDGDEGRWTEEFSLDGFLALLERAARRSGRTPPRVHLRFPYLVGETPGNLPGIEDLRAWVARGAAVVATADPIHHGAGYGTPAPDRRDAADPATRTWARDTIESGFALLARQEFAEFVGHATKARNDFRDAGPVLAEILGRPLTSRVHALELVDYTSGLAADSPTWVAAALVELRPAPASA